MKGITPAVAVVLLLSVTVVAGGIVYNYVETIQQEAEDAQNLDQISELSGSDLSVETCWYDEGEEQISVLYRNSNDDKSINIEGMNVYKDGIVVEESLESEIIDPLDTFQVDIGTDDPEPYPNIEIGRGENLVSHTCLIG